MKTVIGLYWRDEDVQSSIDRLKEAGFAQDRVDVMTHISRKRLIGDQGHPMARSAGWGAVVGIAIYAVFGLGAALAGGKIVAVRSSDELIARAMSILQQENAIGVRTLEV